MSNLLRSRVIIGFLALQTAALPGLAQSWSTTGNAGTSSFTNFVGTTDNTPLIFRSNNIPRMSLTSGQYGGLEVGSATTPSYLSVAGKDDVGTIIPLTISGNILNQTWGNSIGNTMGRLLRFNQGPSMAAGWVNFYDMGIGRDTCFFITNHSVPPVVGNGVIRKRMIVISPQDRVGINLAGDAIGNGAVPTANFHTNGTVRLQNLPSGTGNLLLVDNDGNVFRGGAPKVDSSAVSINNLLAEIVLLKQELAALKDQVNGIKNGGISLIIPDDKSLSQNSPNPFSKTTTVKYYHPATATSVILIIANWQGKMVQQYNLTGKTDQQVVISAGDLPSGTYYYSLIVDGKVTETKKMILTR
jgi:hypothetical protein